MKNLIILLAATILFTSCRPDERHGTCEQVEKVSFRGLNFQFPIKADDALKFSDKTDFNSGWVRTDSILKNTSAKWYTVWHENAYKSNDTLNYLKDALIHSVSFTLFGDQHRSDKEILEELKKEFPGDYQYVFEYESSHYICRSNCLTIIFRRDLPDERMFVPVISFCYGLSEQEARYFGHSTGNIWTYD